MIEANIKIDATPGGLFVTKVMLHTSDNAARLAFRSLHATPLEALAETLAYVNAEAEVLLG